MIGRSGCAPGTQPRTVSSYSSTRVLHHNRAQAFYCADSRVVVELDGAQHLADAKAYSGERVAVGFSMEPRLDDGELVVQTTRSPKVIQDFIHEACRPYPVEDLASRFCPNPLHISMRRSSAGCPSVAPNFEADSNSPGMQKNRSAQLLER